MKIYNRKLAKRIRENEETIERLTARIGEITSAEFFEAKRPIQERIDRDVEMLKQHGYDRRGNKLSSGAA